MSLKRIDDTHVNPELQSERAKATFNTEQMTHVLDGGDYVTERRREVESWALNDKVFTEGPEYYFLSRPEKYDLGIKKSVQYIKKTQELGLGPADAYWYRSIAFPWENAPIGLHMAMFLPTLENQATDEQKDMWLKAAKNYEIVGTYAQTELGHGTHLRGVETTATYDPTTEEFILHSPTPTSAKWWPGGLGKTSNYVVLMAKLFVGGQERGLQPFMVQIRDMATHEPLPGIKVGDIGPKFGYDMIDNGYLMLDHVRVPRINMLMKNAKVLPDGRFVKPKNEKLSYGTMVFVRSMIVMDISKGLSAAATIAIRYSCVRRQSELEPGKPEPQILDYQTQQYKLFPLLATAYANHFAGKEMRDIYFRSNYEIQQGNTEILPELHSLSSGLKAFTTSWTMWGIEQCRLACGGHGYSQASGMAKIYGTCTPGATYEGENTVLLLQTGRYLLKAHNMARGGQKLSGSLAYLSSPMASPSRLGADLKLGDLVEAFKHRARRLIFIVGDQYQAALSQGAKDWKARNDHAVDLIKAATAHCHSWMVENFVRQIEHVETSAAVAAVLTQLCQLYAVYGIIEMCGDFLEDGFISSTQMQTLRKSLYSLLANLRPNAIALVDAFDFCDRHLSSVLGRYDGNVYEKMYEWAQQAPLNQTQVHESFHKYLKPLRQSVTSKL